MGLIKAIGGAVSGTLGDQWKEYFYCDSIDKNVLAVKGQKRTSRRSSNTSGEDNIISSGSVIAVADGQCMMIVEQGKVVEFSAEPGEFVFDSSTEPSIFSGSFGESLLNTFKTVGKRFTFGGDTAKDQRVYYFNTKELIDNKFGTPNPIPFRVVDRNIGLDIDVSVRCSGVYSYKIVDPMLFYTNVCGNIEEPYKREELDSQLKTEFISALQPAFAQISEMQIRPSAIPGHAQELSDAMNEALTQKWTALRGLVRGDEPDHASRRGCGDDQAGAAHGNHARPEHGGGDARRRAGGRDAHRGGQRERRDDGLYGYGHGGAADRHERAGALPNGPAGGAATAAGAAATGARRGRLDLRMRHEEHGQVLRKLRQDASRARADARFVEVRLRRDEHGKILCRMRRTPSRGRRLLDVCLRRGEHGKILCRVRQTPPRGGEALPL